MLSQAPNGDECGPKELSLHATILQERMGLERTFRQSARNLSAVKPDRARFVWTRGGCRAQAG